MPRPSRYMCPSNVFNFGLPSGVNAQPYNTVERL
jgi:hypothetical protein